MKRDESMNDESRKLMDEIIEEIAAEEPIEGLEELDAESEDGGQGEEPDSKVAAKRPAILLVGAAGAGKTSLVEAVCPDGTVPDSDTEQRLASGGLVIYETDFIDFIDFRGLEMGESVDEYLGALESSLAEQRPNHQAPRYECAWLCVDGERGKLQRGDTAMLKRLGENVMAIVTKADKLDSEKSVALMEKINEILPDERVATVSAVEKTGLATLLEKTFDIVCSHLSEEERGEFDEEWRSYFDECEAVSSAHSAEKAEEYIYWASGRAFAIALVPLPLADIGPLIANEAYMIYRIGACYGYAVDQTVIAGFLGCLGASVVGKVAASFLPFLKAPIAAAVTYGVGQAANAYFASGMSLGENELKELFENGKEKAKNIDWKNASKQFGI